MSESGKSHLGHVLSRWLGILEHLETRKRTDFAIELESFMSPGNGTFALRYQRQIKPIHVAVYYLLPETRNKVIPEHFDTQIQVFFRRYATDAADYEAICFEFESFRAQETPFEPGRRCWTLVNHPKLFWLSTFSHTKSLGKLAYRMFCTPVNSVASERAFSAQNIIHTKSRNQLQSERADKLVYLYINGRQVTQFENKLDLARELKSKPLRNFSLDDEVALENLWMDEDVPVDGEIIRSVTNTDGYENEEEDCDENKKSEYEEDDEF